MKQDFFHGHGESEPIGLEYLAGALCNAGFECFFRSHVQLLVTAHNGSRLSMFSALTNEYSQVICEALEAKRRGEITILGGYHACGRPEGESFDLFDYVVIGEGEDASVIIAKAVLQDQKTLIGSFQHFEHEYGPTVLRSPRIRDLDSLSFPLRSEKRLGRYLLYDLIWPPASQQRNTAIILTSRGCRHNCDFCASASVWGQGVTFRSKGNVIAELRELVENYGTNTVVIIDQSFGQAKEWTIDLCDEIKRANLGLSWYHQSNLTIERDVIKAMAAAGCTKIGFGLEGLSPRAIERIKPLNQTDFDAINNVFDYCASLGLFVKAYVMIGFPWETERIIKEYFEWIPKIRASQIKISYMTPFPGTAYWGKYHNNLLTSNWEDFDTVCMPVVYNPNISVREYHNIRRELFRVFYDSEVYTEITQQMINKYPRSVESYKEFAEYLLSFGMVSEKASWLKCISGKGDSLFTMANQRV